MDKLGSTSGTAWHDFVCILLGSLTSKLTNVLDIIDLNHVDKFRPENTHKIFLLARLPGKIQLQENISVAIYRLTPTIKNKILNYKGVIQPIIVDNKISFSSTAGTCCFERSAFRNKHHSHIITGFKNNS